MTLSVIVNSQPKFQISLQGSGKARLRPFIEWTAERLRRLYTDALGLWREYRPPLIQKLNLLGEPGKMIEVRIEDIQAPLSRRKERYIAIAILEAMGYDVASFMPKIGEPC